jgi:hypothetical protein
VELANLTAVRRAKLGQVFVMDPVEIDGAGAETFRRSCQGARVLCPSRQ